ncbi:hypothetical protein KJ695_00820, partial [Patescibacteria group bacterium]|nr:hypothetical protein [Patescibacteria group bacterium]
MNKFLKLTPFKFILTIIITIIPFIAELIYGRSITVYENAVKIQTSFGVMILHQISNIILLPIRFVNSLFLTLLGKNLLVSSVFLNILLFLIYFAILLAESYILSCLFSFIIDKAQNFT